MLVILYFVKVTIWEEKKELEKYVMRNVNGLIL